MESISNYQCGKCEYGTVQVLRKETDEHITMTVKKCSKCKHQYGLKQTFILDPK